MRSLVRRSTVVVLATLALLLHVGLASGAAHGSAQGQAALGRAAVAPTAGALYTDGPDGRFLLGGQWLFRPDPTNVGLASGFQNDSSQVSWSATAVPSAWNATDQSDASMNGSVGWYRKDFRLPDVSPTLAWIVRFESANFHARVWLNGRPLGSHVGAYLAFEFQLTNLNRHGVNRLVIRVDNRLVTPLTGPVIAPQPPYGWWNYGGLLGEVYLRRVDRLDFQQVVIRPDLPCRTCSATIGAQATISNYSSVTQTVHVTGTYGALPLELGSQAIAPGQSVIFSSRARLKRPTLWSPRHPNLYTARLVATAVAPAVAPPRGRAPTAPAPPPQPTRAAGYTLLSGVRSIRVTAGQLILNGLPVHFRAVAVHEDDPLRGGALNNADRAAIIASARDVGATLIRAHHPLHPELQELADRNGFLLWSEIPVYQLSEQELGMASFTTYARDQLQANILQNQNHPSIAIWSIGNELPTMPGPAQTAYIASQTKLAKQLDPTRPVGLPFAVNPVAGCQAAAYAPLDVLGINDYFGWYTGTAGAIADRDALSSYLDSLHACYPRKAMAITELGAEGNRAGPVEEKGTYAFQSDFALFHLLVYGSKPWLDGVTYFTLREFRVAPAWSGGNPWPSPPVHQKGLVSFAGKPKPVYFVVRQAFRRARQYG